MSAQPPSRSVEGGDAVRGPIALHMVISAYERGSFDGNLLDLFEPGFSPAFFPQFLDNTAFPADWFERTSHCARECTQCGYCEQAFKRIVQSF